MSENIKNAGGVSVKADVHITKNTINEQYHVGDSTISQQIADSEKNEHTDENIQESGNETSKPTDFIGAIVALIIGSASGVVDLSGVLTPFSQILEILMLVFLALSVVLVYRHGKKANKCLSDQLNSEEANCSRLVSEIQDLTQRVETLEEGICQGVKFLRNDAKVFFDIRNKKYLLSFTKRYIIISDSIRWYRAQFYCNRTLNNAEESADYYRLHQITWDELQIKASLRYKYPTDSDFTDETDVRFLHAAEGNNYKQFHIEYTTIDGSKLDIRKGCEIELKYSYEVPMRLWGSYLNRYITYFKEPASICLASSEIKTLKNAKIRLYKTKHLDGTPVLQNNYESKMDYDHKLEEHQIFINLEPDFSGKFIVSWDADAIFSERGLNSTIDTDQSQLTNY